MLIECSELTHWTILSVNIHEYCVLKIPLTETLWKWHHISFNFPRPVTILSLSDHHLASRTELDMLHFYINKKQSIWAIVGMLYIENVCMCAVTWAV